MVKKLENQMAVVKQLTPTDGLGKAYDDATDRSIVDYRLYIAETKIGRASDCYDKQHEGANAVECCSCDQSIQVLHVWYEGSFIRCDLARKTDTTVPCVSMGLKTVLWSAPEYGEAAIKLDESLGKVLMGPMQLSI